MTIFVIESRLNLTVNKQQVIKLNFDESVLTKAFDVAAATRAHGKFSAQDVIEYMDPAGAFASYVALRGLDSEMRSLIQGIGTWVYHQGAKYDVMEEKCLPVDRLTDTQYLRYVKAYRKNQ